IKLLDGEVTDDSNPYISSEDITTKMPVITQKMSRKEERKQNKKVSMSFWTAVKLSLSNMFTKMGRTLLTVIAGSIGIIGIALVLSVSNGFQNYIDRVQEDALSSYPITVERSTTDLSSMYITFIEEQDKEITHDMDNVYSNDIITDILNSLSDKVYKNDLKNFKTLIDNDETIQSYINDAKYNYDVQMNIYSPDTTDGVLKVNPSKVVKNALKDYDITLPAALTTDVWTEMIDNDKLLDSQYEVVAGAWPENDNQVVVLVNQYNEISDYTLYTLGLKSEEELLETIENNQNGVITPVNETKFTYDDILNIKYKLVLQSDLYQKKSDGTWSDISADENLMKDVVNAADDISVSGIIRLKEGVSVGSINGNVGYTHGLLTKMITENNNSAIVQEQKNDPDTDVFTKIAFSTDKMTIDDIYAMMAFLPEEEQTAISGMISMFGEDTILEIFNGTENYDDNLSTLGSADLDNPTSISIYAKDFESKENLETYIDQYNKQVTENGEEDKAIKYTDYVAILFSSVSVIINSVTYVLIGFVSISLVVSCIMIGIITHISVLERIKEIGILRSIGASKKDISRVFNAETLIIGVASGTFGILITLILSWPLNAVLKNLTDISHISSLPWLGAIALIAISALLTFIAGLIPAHKASKKDPVEALRSE
ncbi:MAG: ABC transporter permease, partial [Bacilli bacterium]